MSFPVCREVTFGSHQLHRKRGRSVRASSSLYYTLAQKRTARFTARPFSALVLQFVFGFQGRHIRLLSFLVYFPLICSFLHSSCSVAVSSFMFIPGFVILFQLPCSIFVLTRHAKICMRVISACNNSTS